MNIVLFESAGKQKYNAGSKARQDALKIAIDCGYKHIPLFYNGNSHLLIVFEIIYGCLSAICHAGKGDWLLIQYPYQMLLNRFLFWILRFGEKIKKYNVSILIHDFPGLRDQVYNSQSQNNALFSELHMMRGCHLIYHNERMRDICESICPSESYQILGAFDYLYSGEICQRTYSEYPTIMIAGNLSKEKCGYIYQLSVVGGVSFDLFGANYSDEGVECEGNVRYRGKYSPEELVVQMNGQFGLVWDGDTIDTCGGTTGNYLRYNNPHKLSLYIAAGIPVIVWKESALADYVRESGIGICVDSLRQLPEIFDTISAEKYKDMLSKVMRVREEIVQGEHLKLLLKTLEEEI